MEAGKRGGRDGGALGPRGMKGTEERQRMDGFQTCFEGKVYRTRLWIRYKVSGREEGQATIREGFQGARFLTEQLHAKSCHLLVWGSGEQVGCRI